ncbi:MAG: sigma-70 family RNA polymerase sigma factor [Myxococcales bacterium]|nr:sigma-70 family RNA polymerase sigma factor [Myxococcales bacterium]MCB9718994.1 sigma-70 family RNA polymerase sigma factor [Myxococcales bacterium]
MDDWELLEAWREGDAPSGEVLVGRYLGLLTRFFRNKVNDPEDAADLISETMLACTRGKDGVRDSGAFRSFLFAAAMNMLRRYYRKKAKRERELDDFEDICVGDSGNPRSLNSLVSLEQESRLLVRALRRIPLDQQIVLELSYFEGMNGTDIAELLEVPQPTVYTRLRRGKEKLRVVMVELAESPAVAESTMMGLQTWAARVRDEITR